MWVVNRKGGGEEEKLREWQNGLPAILTAMRLLDDVLKLLFLAFAHTSLTLICLAFGSFHERKRSREKSYPPLLYYMQAERNIGVSADERLCKFAINFSFCACVSAVFSTLSLLRSWFTPKNIEELLPYKLLSGCAFHLPSIYYIRTRIEVRTQRGRKKQKAKRKIMWIGKEVFELSEPNISKHINKCDIYWHPNID